MADAAKGTTAEEKNAKVEAEVKASGSNAGGSVLESALYNLNVAQQYIDETDYLAEHRLISFHHGIALLARYRDDHDKLAVAHQYLSDAANWQINEHDWKELGSSYLQVVCESHYNLGVIDEIRSYFDRAIDHYSRAIQVDHKIAALQGSGKDKRPTGIEILARFGRISASMSLVESMRMGTTREKILPSFAKKNNLSKAGILNEMQGLQALLAMHGLNAPVAKRIAKEPSATGKEGPVEVVSQSAGTQVVAMGNQHNLALSRIARKLELMEVELKRASDNDWGLELFG